MDLAKMEVKKGNGVVSEVAEAEGNVMNVAKAQIANNNSRDVIDNNIEDLYVKAGTYYLAVASTDAEFPVSIATAEVPAPEQAVILYPYDGETNVVAPYLAEWVLGDYTEEMQVLVGTQYPPQTALIDWTDYLVESAFILELEPNQSYFMQVNERNAAGTTMGEIIAFTTPINAVDEVIVTNPALYPGDAAMLTWTAPERSFKGYNIYQDGVKINESLVTTTEYAVEDLPYNMDGYVFQVSAVFDAGESALSEPDTAYMTGFGSVNGYVYDTDTLHPIANATMVVVGIDEYGAIQQYEFLTDETGFYEGEVLAGLYAVGILTEGYETAGTVIYVAYDQLTEVEDIITHEFYYPLGQITATEEESDVLVEWSWDPAEMIVDFETGDFSQAEFTLPAQYPWAITTTNPYEGTYCMKSTCEGQASATSYIEATVEVPFAEAKMGFYVKVSSEANYDKFHFYIDGVEKGSALSGQADYVYKEFAVEGGVHTYKWEYTKDSSVNSNDDCIYVDNITMFRKDEPVPPTPGATVYDFDDDTMMGWTSIDADGDGNGWVSSANPGIYHNSSVNLSGTGHNESEAYVISGSYANQTQQALTPDNFLVAPAQISAQDGASISFYACAQDASYAAEHFGVAVSTTGHTSGNDFTTIQEWTMTAKNAPAEESHREVRGTRQGAWYQYTVDLSSYAGQDIWVAIRHFNCSDMFILNVDDITLYDGSAKGDVRANREFVSYNLYRRNNIDAESVENPTLLAEGIAGDVYEYLDTEWPALPFGEWQWGIQATYEGYAPVSERSRETATFGFEGGLEGWTGIVVNTDGGEWIHSDNNLGGYDYTELAHTGTGFAMCYSYVDYDGAYDTDAYLVSPQKYSVDANSSISFWADNANDDYPENFSVCVSTAANPTASDFTQVWSGGAKGTGNGGAAVRRSDNRYENWRSHEVSLAAYAGQEIWIAFHDVNYDMYEIWIDDVTINYAGGAPVPPTPGPTGDGLSEILWSNVIDKDMIATLTINVALNNGQSPVGAVVELEAAELEYEFTVDETGVITEEIRKGEYLVEVELEGYTGIIDILEADTDEIELTYVLNEIIAPVEGLYVSPTGWAMWEGGSVGPTPGPTGDDSFEESFEGGLNGWNVLTVNTDGGDWIHSSQNLGGYDYTELAHTGTGFAMCYSYVDYVGAFNTDSYMYTPQKYDIVNGSTLTFFADNANDTYPENFSVVIATVDNPTAADFTQIWNGGAKGTGSDGAIVRHNDTRYENWRQHTIDLSAYAGQSVYIGFHDVNYDMYEIWIDDVTLSTGAKADRAALSYKVMLDGEYIGETYLPFVQLPVEGMEEGSEHVASIAPLYASGMGEWMSYTFTYTSCDNFAGTTSFETQVNNADVTLTWTLPNGPTPPPTPPTPGEGQWYQYGTDVVATGVGAGGAFYWGIMFPAGTYQGNVVTKAATYEMAGYPFSGSVTIYNDGTTAPATAVGTMPVSVAGTADQWAEFEFAQPVVIDPTKNLWIVFYNETSTTYPAAACTDAGDANARWVSIDGTSWMDLSTAGLPGYSWIMKAYVATANKGEVTEISVPTYACANAGNVSADHIARGNRAAWDLVASFTGSSAGQQAVATDGQYIYTASWQSAPTGGHTFYQYTLDGTFIEGFEIAGATGIRDLTTDGEYFYGTSGGAQIFCMDFTTRTLVSTINCSGLTSRHISYDPERDGFWSGNWSTLALYSRTGALIQNGPAPTSAYGSAYYKDADNVEHLYLFCQPDSDAKVFDYNITTGTLNASPVFDFASTPGFNAGIAGGSFIASYAGKTCWFGNCQQDPNLIGIYELDGSGPVPPTPVEGIIGVVLYRNDEFVGMFDANTTSYVDEGLESGHYDYTIRVIYGGEYDVTYYAMSCGDEAEAEVIIGVTENDEVVNSIYPNPTSGDLYINATAMKHVTVFNAMGQMVLDQEVSGDSMVLNMGQLESGVYMVKVTTETGSNVKRINVVK
ncbi:MAG: choice-of-anchor J domain-containing protein [Bacteroidales bacterium]|nr:choice-of-anchor J domain-containing protein [Bacteroidales bacterium]